jgi:hypothetical protein
MKRLFALLLMIPSLVFATEIIKVYSPYSPSHSGTPAMYKIIDKANESQSIYKFIMEFKPGGNQMIAVKSLDANSLAIIAPAFVENVESGKLNEKDYIPVHALGNACWAVVANKPLKGSKEFTVGGVGFGNAAHLTSLALGEKYGFNVRYIVFKSNNDALINMAGNNGIEMVVDRYEAFENLKEKNKNMYAFAASCPTRLPQAPNLKTLKEMGFNTPYVFNITVANTEMNTARRMTISKILNDAQNDIGADEIFKLSGMKIPADSADEFYTKSITLVRNLQKKYRDKIEQSK